MDPGRIRIDDRFDLIWSGSLFTHIDAPRWPGFLDLLASLLAPGGVLVFTTAGRSVAAEMREGAGEHVFTPSGRSVAAEMREGEYRGMTADLARGLLEDFDRTGFGYRDYPGQTGYGHSRARPSWVCEQVERTAGSSCSATPSGDGTAGRTRSPASAGTRLGSPDARKRCNMSCVCHCHRVAAGAILGAQWGESS